MWRRQRDLEGEAERRNREAIYGVARAAMGRSGPSVVSINGVIASIAVTEFMVAVTGLRKPNGISTYYGHNGKVTVSMDSPRQNCWYCSLWEQGSKADVERHLSQWNREGASVKHCVTRYLGSVSP